MKREYIGNVEKLAAFFYRRGELLRGSAVRWRGARVGYRFGLGRFSLLLYPVCFTAGDNVTIGDLSYLNCLSVRGVKIGSYSSIDRNLWLHCGGTGFFEMGDHSYIGCNAVMGAGGGGIKIGNNVLIGQSVNIHSENHVFEDSSKLIRDQGISHQGVVIGNDVWIGSKATILDGVTIGDGAVIGAGAVVTKSILPFGVAVGVPARVVDSRNS